MSFIEITVAATSRRSGHCKKTDSSIGDSAEESSGFLVYSTSNWYYHIQEARLDGDMALLKRIRRLCDPRNKHCKMWLEAHKHYIADFQVDFRNVNVLWIASYTGMTSLAGHILEEGNHCDTRNPQGQNTVLIAAFWGNDRVLTVLLKSKRIKRDVRDSRRTCPLQAAFISRNPAAMKVLLESGTDAGAWDLWGITPFENAIWHGSDELIMAFVDCGKSEVFNATNVRGKTPLMIAYELGRTALVRDMTDSGSCDVNIQDSIGRTALVYSVLFEEAEIVQALLELPATAADIPDKNGETPLTWAAQLGRGNILQQLIESGKVNIKDIDKFGRTALHRAAESDKYDTANILLLDSADADIPDFQGWTPLMIAAGNGYVHILHRLLATEMVNVNRRNQHGTTALFNATNRGWPNAVQVLLDASADANIPDNEGCTPLMIAALEGDTEIASMLLQSGNADPNRVDEEGRDAMWYADLRNNTEIMELLQNHVSGKFRAPPVDE